MSAKTANRLIELIDNAQGSIKMLDITGGAPEMMEQFRPLVVAARAEGSGDRPVQPDRFVRARAGGLARVPGRQRREGGGLVAVLLGGEHGQTARRGVFSRSIAALVGLNKVGYGVKGTGLELDLMYNPGGAFLPPSEAALTEAYRSELGDTYGVEFSRLVTPTNMPIKRFADFLHREGKPRSTCVCW